MPTCSRSDRRKCFSDNLPIAGFDGDDDDAAEPQTHRNPLSVLGLVCVRLCRIKAERQISAALADTTSSS